MRIKTIILANAPIVNGNRGCVALTVSMLYLIDKIFKKHNVSYKIFLPDSGHTQQIEYAYYINGEKINYTSCYYPTLFTTKYRVISLYPLGQIINSFKVFKTADYILDIGQGDSFTDIYGVRRFNLIDKIHKTARFFKKKYCLLPQTIGPFTNQKILSKAIKSLKKSDFVMVRDKLSKYFISAFLPKKDIREYIDVAFMLPFYHKKFVSDKIHVGLNVSALLWNGGYNQDNQFQLKDSYQDLTTRIINQFLSLPNTIIHLIPHVVDKEQSIENDYQIALALANEFQHENLIVSPLFLSPIEAKSYISGLDFFIGARMHSTIAAISCGIPVYPLAYSRKFNGLFTDTLGYSALGDLKTYTNDEIINDLIEQFKKRSQLKDEIKKIQSNVINPRLDNLEKDLTTFFGL